MKLNKIINENAKAWLILNDLLFYLDDQKKYFQITEQKNSEKLNDRLIKKISKAFESVENVDHGLRFLKIKKEKVKK